jgi:hypothetical protein
VIYFSAKEITMRYFSILLAVCAFTAMVMAAGTALADPDNFGGEGKAWTEYQLGDGSFYGHKNTWSHTKNFDSSQGAGKRFSQPGKAEGKANENSVIQDDPIHPGTQVLPGSNR